jgi:leader peptidase (prepilin peptidase)/N-methyltransferase
LPDVLTLPAIPVFFLAGFGTHFAPWQERAIGAVAGYVAVRLISDGYYYLRGREGLGLGDGKLLSVIGATLGYKALPPIVFFASLFGIVVSVPLLLWMRKKQPAPVAADATVVAVDIAAVEGAGAPSEGTSPPEAPTDAVRFTQVPFGPFLALGALFFLLMGDVLWGWINALLTPQ